MASYPFLLDETVQQLQSIKLINDEEDIQHVSREDGGYAIVY